MKRVLVTGGAGYIGSVLVRQLLAQGYLVRVLDCLRFGGESLAELGGHPHFEVVRADVRDAEAVTRALEGVWGVAHLAAIVGDPACAREPELARSVNIAASQQLYTLAEEQGVARFVFASTCSNYGKMTGPDVYLDETSALRPVSLYAEGKVAVEHFLLTQPRSRRSAPTALRFATVYGLSPRPRFDLTVNEFTKEVALGRELVVFGEQFWRPYCHVQDLARSVVVALEAPAERVAFEVFNVGDSRENYRKGDLVALIERAIPAARVRYVARSEDPRDYRVSFSKIQERLGFRITRTVFDGILEVKRVLETGLLSNPDDPKYLNVQPNSAAPVQAGV